MEESPTLRHPRSESLDAAAAGQLLARARSMLSSREIALKFCVASIAAAALSRLGPVAALGGVVVSLLVESAVEHLVRRLRKRTLWSAGLLAILLDRADRALAAIGLRSRRIAATGATTAAAAVAGALVVVAFTVPELALGHALVADRGLTFFGGRLDSEISRPVPGPGSTTTEPEPGLTTTGPTKPGPRPDLTITVPANMTAEATSGRGAHVDYDASASAGRLVCVPASGSFFPIGTTTVHCTARYGKLSDSATFPVVVADKSPPRLELPEDITFRTAKSDGAIVTYVATASDAVQGDVVARCTPQSGSRFPVGRTTVNCTTVDDHGNRAEGSFAVNVEKKEDGLVLPGHMTVEATSTAGTVVRFTASAGGAAVSCSPRSATRLPLGDTVVSCHTRKERGTFRITVVDTTPPELVLPPKVSALATSRRGAELTYVLTARDAVDGAIVPSCTPRSGATFAVGRSVVRCSAHDSHGNARHVSFGVEVLDGAPTLDLPPTVTAAAADARGASVPLHFAAEDAVDGSIAASCSPAMRIFPIGRTKVTCSAKDSAGNVVSGSLVVVVSDDDAPRLNLPDSPLAVDATGPAGGKATWRVSAVDNVDGSVGVSCDRTSGDVFAVGDTRVNCSARDRAGNVAKDSFTVSVRDHDPPVVTVPSAPVVESADDGDGARVTFAATADDAVDGAVSVKCDPPSGSLFPLGDTRVSCTARDAAGNSSKPASFLVSVRDTNRPRLQLPASPLTAAAVNADGAPVQFAATAVDAVDGSVPVQCDHDSGGNFALGKTRVTCSATDKAGNRATDSFVVVVSDQDGPSLNLPKIVTATANSKDGTNVKWQMSAVDNVDGPVPISCDPAPGSHFEVGDTAVLCSASDSAGNTTRRKLLVRVNFG
jgi:large repetitive protein